MNERVKVEFELSPDDGGLRTERLWAERVGDGQFRVRNSPFFVFGVSAEDVVTAIQLEEDVYRFQRVVEKGGHSTYRIFIRQGTIEDEAFNERWTAIQGLGATYENANNQFVSVDVPPDCDVSKVYDLLKEGEKDGVWTFEEANYEPAAGRVS
jgi:hypothetical protein